MKLQIKEKISTEELRKVLKTKFPNLKIKSPWLNNKMILVQKGGSMVSVKNQNGVLNIDGGVNTQHFGIALGVSIGTLLGFIGAFVFLGIAWVINKEDFERLEKKVEGSLKDHFITI